MSYLVPVNWLSSIWQTVVIWLWVAAAFGGALVVATSLLSSIFSYKISSATEAQAKVERDENVRLTSEADARARNGEARAAIANAEAARANERAAALELQIEHEQTERLRLGAAVEKISPRMLLPLQADAIRASLGQSAIRGVPVALEYDASCADCSSYSAQIGDLLNSLGFRAIGGIVIGPGMRSRRGLALGVPDPQSLPQAIKALTVAFAGAGVAMDVVQQAPHPGMTANITVLPVAAPR